MRKEAFDKINKNIQLLRRTKSCEWLIKAMLMNPNVIVVCAHKHSVFDWQERWKKAVEAINQSLVPEAKPSPVFVSVDDLEKLNDRTKPIIFESYLLGEAP